MNIADNTSKGNVICDIRTKNIRQILILHQKVFIFISNKRVIPFDFASKIIPFDFASKIIPLMQIKKRNTVSFTNSRLIQQKHEFYFSDFSHVPV